MLRIEIINIRLNAKAYCHLGLNFSINCIEFIENTLVKIRTNITRGMKIVVQILDRKGQKEIHAFDRNHK